MTHFHHMELDMLTIVMSMIMHMHTIPIGLCFIDMWGTPQVMMVTIFMYGDVTASDTTHGGV